MNGWAVWISPTRKDWAGRRGEALGVFLGCTFGGTMPRAVADLCFDPEEPEEL